MLYSKDAAFKSQALHAFELTGEDIWTKLQQMYLQEALRTLEEAARP